MSKLFESSTINNMKLSNRFVRSATWEGMATNQGAVTTKLIERMTALARGGVGLIITSHAYVRQEGQAAPWQLGIYKDELVDGLQKMTTSVHECGGKIILQVSHAGNFAVEQLIGQPPLVVSDFDGLAKSPRKEITPGDIQEIVISFADAARRAKSAAFDGIQIHSGHGYLLSQFLSPAFNRRRDSYGGNVGNRTRVHLEICNAIRKAVGNDYPVLIKMNCRDFTENGLDLEDSLQIASFLVEAGIDAIELSGGLITGGKLSPSRQGINSEDKEAYFKEDARFFKRQINIPLILVGGIRSFGVAEQLLGNGIADYISMSRPLIREPDLINRWKAGDYRKAECISDNLCFRPGIKGEGVYCLEEKRKKTG